MPQANIPVPKNIRVARKFTSNSLPQTAAVQEGNPNDIFAVASVGKTFVAGVILQLAEEGKFGKKGIDTKVVDILKDKEIAKKFFKGANKDATIADLLSHHAGLGDFFTEEFVKKIEPNLATPTTVKESLAYSIVDEDGTQYNQANEPISFRKFSYSNTGYAILGQIIEDITGNHWSKEIEDRFINPTKGRGASHNAPKLSDTTTVWTIDEEKKKRVVATTYKETQNPAELKAIHAAGGFFSSTADLTTFARNFFKGIGNEGKENNNLYFDADTVKHMRESALTGKSLGCGAFVKDGEIKNVGQSGAIFGYGASMRYDPTSDSTRVTIVAADDMHAYKTRDVTRENVIKTDQICNAKSQTESWTDWIQKMRSDPTKGKSLGNANEL